MIVNVKARKMRNQFQVCRLIPLAFLEIKPKWLVLRLWQLDSIPNFARLNLSLFIQLGEIIEIKKCRAKLGSKYLVVVLQSFWLLAFLMWDNMCWKHAQNQWPTAKWKPLPCRKCHLRLGISDRVVAPQRSGLERWSHLDWRYSSTKVGMMTFSNNKDRKKIRNSLS